MLTKNHSTFTRKGKLVKVTLHLDENIASYLKTYSKENRLTMSYIVESLIASTENFNKEVSE